MAHRLCLRSQASSDSLNARAARAWMPEVEQRRSNSRTRRPATYMDVQVSREAGGRERPTYMDVSQGDFLRSQVSREAGGRERPTYMDVSQGDFLRSQVSREAGGRERPPCNIDRVCPSTSTNPTTLIRPTATFSRKAGEGNCIGSPRHQPPSSGPAGHLLPQAGEGLITLFGSTLSPDVPRSVSQRHRPDQPPIPPA